jgi:hypothetical protein
VERETDHLPVIPRLNMREPNARLLPRRGESLNKKQLFFICIEECIYPAARTGQFKDNFFSQPAH